MKKLLALALSLSSVALVAAALAAAPASASNWGVWCSTAPENHICPSKYPEGTPFKAELTPGTNIIFKAGVEFQCNGSTLEGSLAYREGYFEKVNRTVSALTLPSVKFSGCTQSVETISTHWGWKFPWAEGTHNSTAGWGDSRVKITFASLGITCYYNIPGEFFQKGVEMIGGNPAHIRIHATQIPRAEGSNTFFCASQATMSAEWTVTSPSPLYVEKE